MVNADFFTSSTALTLFLVVKAISPWDCQKYQREIVIGQLLCVFHPLLDVAMVFNNLGVDLLVRVEVDHVSIVCLSCSLGLCHGSLFFTYAFRT